MSVSVIVYRCPAGEKLKFYYASEEQGQKMRRYWTNACKTCAIKDRCSTGKEHRITRWEHEHVLETVQQRLDVMNIIGTKALLAAIRA